LSIVVDSSVLVAALVDVGPHGQLSAKSELSSAIRCAMSRWKARSRYRDDGNFEIDNNATRIAGHLLVNPPILHLAAALRAGIPH
jgi:hypothetical protein